jgi:hypothetical protein
MRRVEVVARDAIHGQQQLSLSSPDDRVPRRGLTGFVAAELTRPTMTTPLPLPLLPSSPLSFSDAIKKAKVADAATAEAEKVRDEGGQQAQATALQPSKTQHAMPQRDNEKGSDAHAAAGRHAEEDEDKDEDEEVELPMPGSFDFGTTTPVLRVRVSSESIRSMRSACSGTCGGARR